MFIFKETANFDRSRYLCVIGIMDYGFVILMIMNASFHMNQYSAVSSVDTIYFFHLHALFYQNIHANWKSIQINAPLMKTNLYVESQYVHVWLQLFKWIFSPESVAFNRFHMDHIDSWFHADFIDFMRLRALSTMKKSMLDFPYLFI